VSDAAPVLVEQVGCAAVITLNNPARRNVLTAESVAALVEAVEHAESRPSLRAIVITGAGRAFCAGAELSILEDAGSGDFAPVRALYDGFLRVMNSPLLTIAAVNGPAVGAGMNLALVCDIRLAADSAFFDTRFARLHVHPGGGNAWLMHRAVGYQNSCLALLLGEVWDASTALSRGLVAQVVHGDRLREDACALAERVEGHDREVVGRVLLRAVRDGATHSETLELEAEAQRWSLAQPNAAAALAAIRGQISER
jgi:enoyl-CoA hydratase